MAWLISTALGKMKKLLFVQMESVQLYHIFEMKNEIVNFKAYVLYVSLNKSLNTPFTLVYLPPSQGTHSSLRDDQHAMSIVSGIIDGTGSMGAAAGPLVVGLVSDKAVSVYSKIVQDVLKSAQSLHQEAK